MYKCDDTKYLNKSPKMLIPETFIEKQDQVPECCSYLTISFKRGDWNGETGEPSPLWEES